MLPQPVSLSGSNSVANETLDVTHGHTRAGVTLGCTGLYPWVAALGCTKQKVRQSGSHIT